MPDRDEARERRARARAEREQTAERSTGDSSSPDEERRRDEPRGRERGGSEQESSGGRGKVAATAVATAGGAAAGFGLVRLLQWVRAHRNGSSDDAAPEHLPRGEQVKKTSKSPAERGREESRPEGYESDDLGTALKDVALDLAMALTDAARKSKAKAG